MPDRPADPRRHPPALGWRPELSGVRAIAVLLVLGAHLSLPLPNGGPVGVTVFFVLSGFLITTILMEEWARTGFVDVRRFYLRRVRRLLPALLVAVVVVAVVAVAAGPPGAIVGDSVLALTYLSNWARAGGDPMGMWNHAWSLAIEEQFYLLWPIAFVALRRLGPMTAGRTILAIVALAIASAAARAILMVSGATDERTYFGSDTRAEALLIGCALAGIVARGPRPLTAPRWSVPAALIALGVMVVWPDPSLPWPGASYTIVAIASAVLIVGALGTSTRLAASPLVWLGERSYSLYLWHVPVILAVGPMLTGLPGIVATAGLALISVVLAAVSYAFVEQPFRRVRMPASAPATVPVNLVPERSG